jgi:hypothetical protein
LTKSVFYMYCTRTLAKSEGAVTWDCKILRSLFS